MNGNPAWAVMLWWRAQMRTMRRRWPERCVDQSCPWCQLLAGRLEEAMEQCGWVAP